MSTRPLDDILDDMCENYNSRCSIQTILACSRRKALWCVMRDGVEDSSTTKKETPLGVGKRRQACWRVFGAVRCSFSCSGERAKSEERIRFSVRKRRSKLAEFCKVFWPQGAKSSLSSRPVTALRFLVSLLNNTILLIHSERRGRPRCHTNEAETGGN